jgi:hypothetical protein
LTAEVSYSRNLFLQQLPLMRNGMPKNYIVHEKLSTKAARRAVCTRKTLH